MTNNSVWFIETVALASKYRQTCSAKSSIDQYGGMSAEYR